MSHKPFEKEKYVFGGRQMLATVNPLFKKARSITPPGKTARPTFRNILEVNKGPLSVVIAVLFFVLFVVCPGAITVSISKTTENIMIRRTAALFIAAVVQPLTLFFIVSPQTRRSLARSTKPLIYKVILCCCIFCVSFVFWHPSSELKTTLKPTAIQPPTHGSCKLLEEIPNIFVDTFQGRQKQRKHMLYYPSANYSFAMKYARASAYALDTAVGFLLSVANNDLTNKPGCPGTRAIIPQMFFRVFRPCNEHCELAEFICQEDCDFLNCFKKNGTISSSRLNLDFERVFGQYKMLLTSTLSPIFKRHVEEKYQGDMTFWIEDCIKYILEQYHVFANAHEKLCKSIVAVKLTPGSSCYQINGHTVRFPSTSPREYFSHNCSMASIYEYERSQSSETPSTDQSQTNEGLSASSIVDIGTFVLFYTSCLSMFSDWKKSSVQEIGVKSFSFKKAEKCSLISLSILALSCSLILYYFIFAPFANDYNRTNTTSNGSTRLAVGSVYSIISATVFLCTSTSMYLMFRACFGEGEMVSSDESKANTPQSNKLIRLMQVYKTNTKLDGGKYFFVEMIFWEVFEIVVQISSLHTFSAQKPQLYVVLSTTFFLLNMVLTPIFVYMHTKLGGQRSDDNRKRKKSKRNLLSSADRVRNIFFLAADTFVDLLYFGLNIMYLRPLDLFKSPLIGSLSVAQPIVVFMFRVHDMADAVAVRESKVSKLENAKMPRGGHCSVDREERVKRSLEKINQARLCQLNGVFLCATGIFAIFQWLYVLSSVVEINKQCSSQLGEALWNGAWPKYTFENGVFGVQSCAYNKIEEIIAPRKALTEVSKHIGKCTRLKKLNLEHNSLSALPRDLLMMSGIKEVSLKGNEVSRVLFAQGLTLRGSIPPFIAQHMSQTLEYLDLSHNEINQITESVAMFQKLRVLKLSNNSILPHKLSWTIATMVHQLEEFVVDSNPVASYMNWANQPGFQQLIDPHSSKNLDVAILFLAKFFRPTLIALNLSRSSLFNHPHVSAIVRSFPNLKILDVSHGDRLEGTIQSPLNLSLTSVLQEIKVLNLEGCLKVTSISLDDLEVMEEKIAKQSVEFNIHKTGIRQINFRGHYKRKYPTNVFYQIKDQIDMVMFKSSSFINFDLDVLCEYSRVHTMIFRYEVQEGNHTSFCVPACWERLSNLNEVYLNKMPLNMTCFYRNQIRAFSNTKRLHIDFRWSPHDYYFTGPFPDFGNKSNLSLLSLEYLNPTNNFPASYQHLTSLGVHVGNLTKLVIPREWRTLKHLYLTSDFDKPPVISGSVENLMSLSALYIPRVQDTGGILRLGENPYCLVINRPLGVSNTSSLGICSDLALTTLSLDLSHFRATVFGSMVKNCSFPTSSGFVSMLCLATRFEEMHASSLHFGVWECYQHDSPSLRGGIDSALCFDYARFLIF